MATADSTGNGKSPEQIEAEQPSDEQFVEYLDGQTAPSEGPPEAPSREELWQVVQEQQDQIESMAQRIDELETTVEDVEFQADTIEEVAEQFRAGEIGGDAGAEFIQEFVEDPGSGTLRDARAKQLFYQIIRSRRVGQPVTSSKVVQWLELHDSANPSVQAKRVMERLERFREDGFLLGSIETGKHRGKNCIWLNREQ